MVERSAYHELESMDTSPEAKARARAMGKARAADKPLTETEKRQIRENLKRKAMQGDRELSGKTRAESRYGMK